MTAGTGGNGRNVADRPRVPEYPPSTEGSAAFSRRRFLGYLIAAPTLMAGAELLMAGPTNAAQPTSNLITVVVNPDGTASFALPRSENGQGITTSIAMVIAEEMGLPLEKVKVTLADARPELVWNQLTGGSNTLHAMYTPV